MRFARTHFIRRKNALSISSSAKQTLKHYLETFDASVQKFEKFFLFKMGGYFSSFLIETWANSIVCLQCSPGLLASVCRGWCSESTAVISSWSAGWMYSYIEFPVSSTCKGRGRVEAGCGGPQPGPCGGCAVPSRLLHRPQHVILPGHLDRNRVFQRSDRQ